MSTLLQDVIVAHRCRSTHHHIAIEALNLFSGPDAEGWRRFLLVKHQPLLRGAKAPDAEFKDFRNHVLHISEGEWGGARGAAAEWYGRAVAALRNKKWDDGAFALGVLSHYFADPVQPFHTGQTEEEGAIHRALEWSIARSRGEIKRRIEEKGYPDVPAGDGPGFVSDMVRAGAERSHPHYRTFIDHYDIDAGVKDPPAGLDETLLDTIADLCAFATKGVAILFERACMEAGVAPPRVNLTVNGYLSTLDIPIQWVLAKIDDASARRTVKAMYRELQKTGKVIRRLPEDDKEIRRLHARDVLRVPMKELDARAPGPTGTKHVPRTATPKAEPHFAKALAPAPPSPAPKPVKQTEKPSAAQPPEPPVVKQARGEPARTQLTLSSHVVAAPSIGRKTAARLARVGVSSIGDLLSAVPDELAGKLAVRHITPETITDWQDQAKLKLALPGLRVHDVQILVGAGYRTPEDVAAASASELLAAATAFVDTPAAQRIIDRNNTPDKAEIGEWIEQARAAEA